MKKLLCCLVLLMALMLISSVAMAEGELPTEPFTWEYLATIAGATVATLLIVQLLKLPLDKVWKIPTRIVVYVISLIILQSDCSERCPYCSECRNCRARCHGSIRGHVQETGKTGQRIMM